ncbi:M23 family metallopeptidase [Microbacterium sp. CFBP9023]|uniref:M23 family metallopeptidase n=1 Tax=Microbacterium sp. CFBP9023 TaxID=3096535 RepID=UPI002A6A45B6|nr:M23 family metallopeptidase [Microbacterium sp. CFBP9023]MDY0984779.1 M23 family metallopeptidase [Microbacterium sp. CFBP9023]
MCDAGDSEPSSTDATQSFVSRRGVLLGTGFVLGAAAVGWEFFSPTLRASAEGTYLRPCGIVPISSSWMGHRNRNPPSGEPGTDYAVVRGTPIRAATSGVIVDRKDSTTTATGRYLALRTDDGNYIRYLHLQSSTVPLGARVSRGQLIAYSGASGFGSETGYGPHVHVSLWIGGTPLQLGFTNSVDFENYVEGGPIKPPSEDPVPIHQSSTYQWNAVVPRGIWTRIPVAADLYWLAHSSATVKETGDVAIYLTTAKVTKGFQLRIVAETLNSSGAPIASAPQPPFEVPVTRAEAPNSPTYGQYSLPYFLSGPVRLFAEIRALNTGIIVQEVTVKKNYWLS